jgi:hypothetical protein
MGPAKLLVAYPKPTACFFCWAFAKARKGLCPQLNASTPQTFLLLNNTFKPTCLRTYMSSNCCLFFSGVLYITSSAFTPSIHVTCPALLIIPYYFTVTPTRVGPSSRASKAWVYDRSLADIACSNSAGGMDVSLVCAVCCQRFPPRADHSFRGVPMIMVCLSMIVNSQ